MKAYWDSSALVFTVHDEQLRQRLKSEGARTRLHSLAECFSTLTGGGNLRIRVTAEQAAEALEHLAEHLDFVELKKEDVFQALRDARKHGVRGGRIHDFMHVVAAEKCGAKKS